MHTPIESPRGRLLEQYVCTRIVRMDGVDIGLFDYDRHNAVYYFALNADEYIYLRYGGRDADAPDTYLDLNSFEIALKLGLEQHAKYQRGELPPQERPAPYFPEDMPLLREEVIEGGRCVECHLIGDYDLQQKQQAGTLDRVKDLFGYPDIKTIGIHLDVPNGLVVENAEGAVAEAGMHAGDLITAINGTRVLTFGDLQQAYHLVDRAATELALTVSRGTESHDLTVALPLEWWWTDLFHRFLTVDPQLYYDSRKLTLEEKTSLGLKPDGFACEVIKTNPGATTFALHQLKVGDIIYAVDGVEEDTFTQNVEIYIKLHKQAGEEFMIALIRDGERMDMKVKTRRQSFRKPE